MTVRFTVVVAIVQLVAVGPATAHCQDTVVPAFRRVFIDTSPPPQPYYKLVGDLSGDSRPEIIVAGRAGPIVMYSGPDWTRSLIAEGGFNGGVNGELADVDGDGRLDIVMGGVVWFRNPTTDSGAWTVHRVDNQQVHDMEAADLNGDGRLDLVARDQSAFGRRGNQVFVYQQRGPESWEKTVLGCPHGEGLKVADLNGDDRPDIVIGGIWFRNDSGSWSEFSWAPEWSELDTKVEVGDVNGDRRPDIVVTPSELKGERYRISWFERSSGGVTQPWEEHEIVPDVECVIHGLALGDFNLDGRLDVAWAEMHQGEDPDEVVVMLNLEGGLRWRRIVIDSEGSHDIVAADLDGDGDLDILGANHAGDHPVVIWENQVGSATR